MSILSLSFLFSGCSQKSKTPATPSEQLTSISIFQNHMDRTYSYSFRAWQKNGSCLLDADCMLVNYDSNNYDCQEIKLESKPVSKDDFNKFVELDEKYHFYEHIQPKKKSSPFFIADETITGFSAKYGNNIYNIETKGDLYNDVYNLFVELAQKYAE